MIVSGLEEFVRWPSKAVDSTSMYSEGVDSIGDGLGRPSYKSREWRRPWKAIVHIGGNCDGLGRPSYDWWRLLEGLGLVLITATNGARQPGSASAAGFSPDSHFIGAFEKHHDRTIGRVAMEDVLVEIVFAWPRVAVDDPKVLHVQTDGRVS